MYSRYECVKTAPTEIISDAKKNVLVFVIKQCILPQDFFSLQQDFFSYSKRKNLVLRKQNSCGGKKSFVTTSRNIFMVLVIISESVRSFYPD